MPISLPSLSSSLSLPSNKFYGFPFKPTSRHVFPTRIPKQSSQLLCSSLLPIQSFKPINHSALVSVEKLRYGFGRKLGFCSKAVENGSGESDSIVNDEAEVENRGGESTMPSRFRYLTKEAPDPPVRWPWFVALAFLLYAWRAVLFELRNWRKAAGAVILFVGYLFKLVLALIFHIAGNPIYSIIRFTETAFYTVRAFYSSIVAYASVPELTMIIILASLILSIGEATIPDSVVSQPHVLTLSGLIGYAAVRGFISEPVFWTLLVGLYGFSRIVKKRDNVSAVLPVAAVLVAVGEPWVRILVLTGYVALAITHDSKKNSKEMEGVKVEVPASKRMVPLPLLGVALAIGIRLAAKWAGYRHLTWMIV